MNSRPEGGTAAVIGASDAGGGALVLEHCHDLLPLEESGRLVMLSARVGGIGDTDATSPDDAAHHLLAVLDGLQATPAGGSLAWDGTVIAW